MKRSIGSILLFLGLFSIAVPARADFIGVVVSVGDEVVAISDSL